MIYRAHTGATLAFYFIYMFSRRVTADVPNTDDLDQNFHPSMKTFYKDLVRVPPVEHNGSKARFLQAMRNQHSRGLSALRETLSSLDDDLADYQKRTCQFGFNSHHCKLSALDVVKGASNWLNSGHSPGKRSHQITNPDITAKYSRILDEINRKRENLAVLRGILEDAESQVTLKRKRSCHLNLGGRCATELASAIADQYYYLNGPNSPGKRKRRSLFN